MLRNLIILLFCGLLYAGCTEVVEPTEDEIGREYLPLAVGNFWIYDVTETRYTNKLETQPGDSVKYQVRERVTEMYKDQTGQPTYRIIRSRRATPDLAWGSDSVVLVNKSASNVRFTRNNIKTVNLVFPVNNTQAWNGNAFNSRGEEEYRYVDAGNPFPMGDTIYGQTVRVIQADSKNNIELDDRQEVYANRVGMIYKRVYDINYCSEPSTQGNCTIGAGFIIKGMKRVQRLREFSIVRQE